MPLRIVFFGTAELAVASLEALARLCDFEVAAVVTQPDKPRGRNLEVQPSPVKASAMRLGLPVLQPKRAREEPFIAELRSLAPGLIVVAAYGQILPQTILDLPLHGCLNVHTSLLPKYRGAAPIQWVLLEGETETGVTIMRMDAGLDTGPILTQRTIPIGPKETAQTLHDRLASAGADLLVQTIPDYLAGKITPVPQPEGASYARKIEKADGAIDWKESAEVIDRKIRAFTPWPGAFAFLQSGDQRRLIKIQEADATTENGAPGQVLHADRSGILVGCGRGALRIKTLQLEGRKRMSAQEFLAGHPLRAGQVFA